jgi:D-alanyl-D-alanine-carboxypeptidase/D-alanyl-D-alanine-endopeptidase
MMRSLSFAAATLMTLAVLSAARVSTAGPSLAAGAAAGTKAGLPSDAEIRRWLAVRVDTQRQATGIVVGIVAPGGERVVTYGTRGLADKRAMTVDTVFDIGSITKLFTALLLSDLAQRGQVALDDPLAKHLPDGVHVAERNHRPITLADLATHTAGLPLRPTNLVSTDPDNKYAGYTVELLNQFVAGYTLTRDPGSAYEYSNVGYGLLGEAVTHVLG